MKGDSLMNAVKTVKKALAAAIVALCFGAASLAMAAPLKIAIVAPSAKNDLAFTQSIVDGINAIKA